MISIIIVQIFNSFLAIVYRHGDTKARATIKSERALAALPKRNFSSILPNLPIQFSGRLLANAKAQSLAEREVLFQAGDVADGCYRFEHGVLKVSIPSPQGDERILTILGPGSIVGELAIIDGLPRSATVVAIRDCKLSFISRPSPIAYENIPKFTAISPLRAYRACAKPMRRWQPQAF